MEAKTITVRPALGVLVRDPNTGQPIPREGMPVRLSDHRRATFYRRRIKDGDLVVVAPDSSTRRTPQPESEE